MDWNSYRKYHKQKFGTTSVATLSKDYKTYKKTSPKKILSRKLKVGEGRGSPTRGWGKASPKGKNRHALKKKCGNSAFLDPTNEKFPVKNKKCEYVCEGLNAAKNRACQYNHQTIADKAQKLGEKHCGFSPKRQACKK